MCIIGPGNKQQTDAVINGSWPSMRTRLLQLMHSAPPITAINIWQLVSS